eukprot:SAG22_NODE_10151_length_550_cov_0.893570_1_plen_143_part_10
MALNRHEIFGDLLTAWNTTGNPAYPALFDNLTADWIAQNRPPSDISGSGPPGPWETIQVGIRMDGPWADAFFGFQHATLFKPSTRLSMIASVAEHGRFLHDFASRGNPNFESMQYRGLGRIAMVWPEFLNSSEWLSTAAAGLA